jgi:hypothetical protein
MRKTDENTMAYMGHELLPATCESLSTGRREAGLQEHLYNTVLWMTGKKCTLMYGGSRDVWAIRRVDARMDIGWTPELMAGERKTGRKFGERIVGRVARWTNYWIDGLLLR